MLPARVKQFITNIGDKLCKLHKPIILNGYRSCIGILRYFIYIFLKILIFARCTHGYKRNNFYKQLVDCLKCIDPKSGFANCINCVDKKDYYLNITKRVIWTYL